MTNRSLVHAFGLISFSALALGGCNAVLGVGDYSADLDGSAGGMAAGVGGSGPVAGAGGTGPSAGASGKGGVAGMGTAGAAGMGTAGVGASGSAGAGATGGGTAGSGGSGPVTCGSAPPAVDADVLKSCLLLVGCGPFKPDVAISDCLTFAYPKIVKYACEAAATTCDGIHNCQGTGTAPTGSCGATEKGVKCDGNKRLACFGNGTGAYYDDCTKLGGTCEMVMDTASGAPNPYCHLPGTCTDTDGMAKVYHCQGSKIYECFGGKLYGQDCANLTGGADCLAGGTPDASCYYKLPACSSPSTYTCAADGSATYCSAQSQQISYRCGLAGESCAQLANSTTCLAPGCTGTDVQACKESCTGTVLHTCVGGAPLDVDCAAHGFTACGTDTLSDGTTAIAECY